MSLSASISSSIGSSSTVQHQSGQSQPNSTNPTDQNHRISSVSNRILPHSFPSSHLEPLNSDLYEPEPEIELPDNFGPFLSDDFPENNFSTIQQTSSSSSSAPFGSHSLTNNSENLSRNSGIASQVPLSNFNQQTNSSGEEQSIDDSLRLVEAAQLLDAAMTTQSLSIADVAEKAQITVSKVRTILKGVRIDDEIWNAITQALKLPARNLTPAVYKKTNSSSTMQSINNSNNSSPFFMLKEAGALVTEAIKNQGLDNEKVAEKIKAKRQDLEKILQDLENVQHGIRISEMSWAAISQELNLEPGKLVPSRSKNSSRNGKRKKHSENSEEKDFNQGDARKKGKPSADLASTSSSQPIEDTWLKEKVPPLSEEDLLPLHLDLGWLNEIPLSPPSLPNEGNQKSLGVPSEMSLTGSNQQTNSSSHRKKPPNKHSEPFTLRAAGALVTEAIAKNPSAKNMLKEAGVAEEMVLKIQSAERIPNDIWSKITKALDLKPGKLVPLRSNQQKTNSSSHRKKNPNKHSEPFTLRAAGALVTEAIAKNPSAKNMLKQAAVAEEVVLRIQSAERIPNNIWSKITKALNLPYRDLPPRKKPSVNHLQGISSGMLKTKEENLLKKPKVTPITSSDGQDGKIFQIDDKTYTIYPSTIKQKIENFETEYKKKYKTKLLQKDLLKATGLRSPKILRKYRNGEIVGRWEDLVGIAAALGITMEELSVNKVPTNS